MSSYFDNYRKFWQSMEEVNKHNKLQNGLLSSLSPQCNALSKALNISSSLETSKLLQAHNKLLDNLKSSRLPEAYKLLEAQENLLHDVKSSAITHSGIVEGIINNKNYLKDRLNFVPSINKDLDKWQQSITSNQNGLASIQLENITALTAWDRSLTKMTSKLKDINLIENKPLLAERLLEPSKLYTNFACKTIERLENNQNAEIFKALKASLHLAETQFLSSTDIISRIVIEPKDEESISSPSPLLLPEIQQEELIDYVDTGEEDEDYLISLSFSARLSQDTREVLQLVIQCNELSKVCNQREIFKPTTKVLEAFTDLPWLIANDKNTLAIIVDFLYFIFYEGAGKDNLRFLDSSGGVLDGKDCDFIWCIKHLRNKWLRHDADHGKQFKIDKSWKELSIQLNWLGLSYLPVHKEHFQKIHHNLIKQAKRFLEKIIDNYISNQAN